MGVLFFGSCLTVPGRAGNDIVATTQDGDRRQAGGGGAGIIARIAADKTVARRDGTGGKRGGGAKGDGTRAAVPVWIDNDVSIIGGQGINVPQQTIAN